MYCVNVNKLVFKQGCCSSVLRIVLLLYGFLKLLIALWRHQLFTLELNRREKKFNNIKMEQSKSRNFVLYNPPDHGNHEHAPESQLFQVDPLGHANANFRSPEANFAEAKPVHNYSIQTGEEFALEFMLDRVNPRKPNAPNISAEPSHAPRYLELRGVLGISHTGSDSGSDISKISIAEKGSKEFERKNSSLHEDKSNYDSVRSMQSVPRNSSDWTLMYTSSGASDSSSTKLKILCSCGGKILPRPSDGKLRYVGGETRMIRISKDITWQELWQKTTSIYDETHTIKYQLPGEELDALVSVSSDDDLLNMMEECNVLEDGEGSKKLRMFLFSSSDLDDAHFTLANSDGDSEIKYVVAVNGMDMGSRKGSAQHGLANSYGNDLNEIDLQNIESAPNKAANEFVGVSTSNSAGLAGLSSVNMSSQSILPGSSKIYETDLHFDQGRIAHQDDHKQQPLQYLYNLHTPYFSPSEGSVPQSSYGLVAQKKDLEGQKLNGFAVQGTKEQEKEAKLKVDGLIRPESGNESNQTFTEQLVSSQAYNGNVNTGFPVEESSVLVPKLDRDSSAKTLKNDMPQEPMKFSKPFDAVNPSRVPISGGNDYDACSEALVPESIKSEPDPDLSYFEPSIPQRIFYSERIPREQGELLNRISKSDDSHSSQFLVNHSRSEVAQQDFINGSDEKEQNINPDILTEQSISTERPFPVDTATHDNLHVKAQKLKQVDSMDVNPKQENQFLMAEAKAGLKLPAASHVDSTKYHEDQTKSLPQVHWVEKASSESLADNAHEHPEPSAWTGTQDGSTGVPQNKQGVVIDINDRFPRDLLSDIFSKAILSDSASNIGQLQKDGAGLSVNIENHEPQHWSYFLRLAGDEFSRRDVSLMDQDHIGFSSGLPKVEEGAPLTYEFAPLTTDGPSHSEVQDTFGEDDHKIIPGGEGSASVVMDSNYRTSQVKASEGMQYDDLMDNTRVRDSEYEDGIASIGLPPLDPSLVDFDINALQIIKNEDLEELRELGSGTFGTVYHGKWRGSDVAIKRIKKSCFTGRQSEQERLTIEFWREAEILSKLHHPNVVAFYGVVQDGPGGTMATVTEYMVDGSLRHVLLRKDRHLDRRKRLMIAMDAAFGMEYLHSKNIVHFDLKCDNLLVNLKDPSRPICKVGDFGLSKIKRNTLVSGGVRGTLPWMAPELLNGSSNKVSEKVDVFSFGIVLWEILTGEEPYANMHYGAIIGIVSNTLRPTIPSHCDPEWRRLMEQCWAPNPAARPTFTEITNRLRVMSASAQTRKTSS
ncbi:Tyrosine kinase [Olea europaea subsp. europaea]|uniref:Tyrosine kinase n=1 Tax=Olea europaea subsp. europaea TaxID=158383 RepID=A0A8S0TUK6_OLEEU|nr:Tyrosine kinase [Olea europaea subsp. europaea]